MILGVYIFIKKGRRFIFSRELEPLDDDNRELIDTAIIKIVNDFKSYEEGFYRIALPNQQKLLFAVYGEVLSIVRIQPELKAGDKPLTPELLDANDALFASIIFNQPLLTDLIRKEAAQEKFSFYRQELPAEKQVIGKPEKASTELPLDSTAKHYFKELDDIIGEVNLNLNQALGDLPKKQEPITLQTVFSRFTELTFHYARMYLMENLIRDLIDDHAGRPITEIRMGVNDFLFYIRKSLYVLRDRPEIRYFLQIMEGHRIGIRIKNRTEFTVLFSDNTIQVLDKISKDVPIVSFGSVDVVINLILGKLDVLKVALSKSVKATKLHKLVDIAAPFAAILLRIYKGKLAEVEEKKISIKRLTLEGLAQLIQALFVTNLEVNPKRRERIQGIKKRILLHILDKGIITLIVKGEKIEVFVGKTKKEPDVIIQGYLENICAYANNEVTFITALRKIKLLKAISMNPIDIIKGKTFTQLSELFTLWRLSRI
ncbi:MAG: hypothetical protein ACTSRS_06845 [Candidatus Helarchaeota archaeon]